MNIPNADHPIWSLARLAIVNASILIALATITTKWDGELIVILAALGATGVVEIANRFTNKTQ